MLHRTFREELLRKAERRAIYRMCDPSVVEEIAPAPVPPLSSLLPVRRERRPMYPC